MGDSSCSACSRTASYNSLGEREREREGGGGGGGERGRGRKREEERRVLGVTKGQMRDVATLLMRGGRIKWQVSGRKEGPTFAGAHGGVDILCGLHKLPECTTIFRCYELTAKNKLQ